MSRIHDIFLAIFPFYCFRFGKIYKQIEVKWLLQIKQEREKANLFYCILLDCSECSMFECNIINRNSITFVIHSCNFRVLSYAKSEHFPQGMPIANLSLRKSIISPRILEFQIIFLENTQQTLCYDCARHNFMILFSILHCLQCPSSCV